jgi:imidazolonepropionase-like amidohydrolase
MSKVKSKAVWLGFILLLSAFTNYPVAAVPEIKDTNIIIIYAGTLLEVPGQTVKTRQTVVIENKNIQSIHDGYLSAQALQLKPTQIKIIDLKNLFVLPGLIDAHVHLLNRSDQKFRQLHISDEEKLIYGVVNARLTLDAGFTTVADLDAVGHSWPLLVLRNAINAGNIPGPRVFAAGDSISSTGGHGDFLDNRDELLSNHNSPGLCDGPDECRRAVRRQFRQDADLIKIMASGGGDLPP